MKTFFFFLLIISFSTFLFSTIINIPLDQPTIQEGINAASTGDTVLVQPGTYFENINYNGKNITVASIFLTTNDTTYISQTIIDGNQNGSVTTFDTGEDSTAVLSGFSIINGYGCSYPDITTGGGITCINSSPSMINVTIMDNSTGCFGQGGGIYCDNSSPSFAKVTISGNSAGVEDDGEGGGIYCRNSSPSLQNVTISRNFASYGGGIFFYGNSNPSFEEVTITGNSAYVGGGIHCSSSITSLQNLTITGNSAIRGGGICLSGSSFDPLDRCNIFLNFAETGCDLYSATSITIDVIVDTFTVIQPDDFFAYPIDNFTFDILNAKIEQVDQDLYVSPDGSNNNSGLTVADPLLTISHALVKTLPDSTNPLIIHLSSGTYSPSLTGEIFPLYCRSYVSLLGEEETSTILDGEGFSGILFCDNENNFSIMNMTIQNGLTAIWWMEYLGGGIHCSNYSNPSIENVTISGSIGPYGGGINCSGYSNPSLENVTISDNSSAGIYCSWYAYPSLQNVTISGNNEEIWEGGGIYCCFGSNLNLTNSILWNNLPDEIFNELSSVTVTYSDIQGGWVGTGNIDEDPQFVDPLTGDYHLTEFSPCIDAGDPSFPLDPDGTRADMGAYYFHQQYFGPIWHISTAGSDITGNGSEQLPFATIQNGIEFSNVSDTVLVQPGTYFENINYNGKNITVASLYLTTQDTTYISQTIIDGSAPFAGSVVTFESGEPLNSVLTGFTICNGSGNFSSIGMAMAGGGIYCDYSGPTLNDLVITNNSTQIGGGIYCSNSSSPNLENVTITNNSAEFGCGGFECGWDSNPSLKNVTISDNSGDGFSCSSFSFPSLKNVRIADNLGSGIYCSSESGPSLENVTITGNTLTGIFFNGNTYPNFSEDDRCNIYANSVENSRGLGADVLSADCGLMHIIVDTFSVMTPTDHFASPIDNFTFDILNAKIEQIDQDLYVSPDGLDENSGLTVNDPLLTISYALTKILADSTNALTIYLAEGVYSNSTNGELFPLHWSNYVNLSGSSEDETVLNAENISRVMSFSEITHADISNITVSNGFSNSYGGGIFCKSNSSPKFVNVTITNSTAGYGGGGGICCYENSSPILENVTISENIAESRGGGIYCSGSDLSLENVSVTGNTAGYGGGIYCSGSDPSLENVSVTGNTAGYGGGIYCSGSDPSLERITITGNTANLGGGIYLSCSYPNFSFENRCNIYSNSTETPRGLGADISGNIMHIIVDTFTVMKPTDHYASPISNFTFDILHSVVDSLINMDVYVSVDGDNSNSGITPELPFKTIIHALEKIYSDSLNINTIHLAEGVYSNSTNGEIFPIHWSNYVNLSGNSENETVLDAENISRVMDFYLVTDVIISNITVTNGFASGPYSAGYGGGIYCASNSSPSLINVRITANTAGSGGGIYCSNNANPNLEHVTISGNTAHYGGGICCTYANPSLENIIFSSNFAEGRGGAIYCRSSHPNLMNVNIIGNFAEWRGGGIYCDSSDPNLENVTLSGNIASSGGGIYCYSSDPSLKYVTISTNSALGNGGGIYCNYNSSVSLINCILWNDLPYEICFYENFSSNSVTISYSDIQGGESGIVTNNNGTVNWMGGNIDDDPLFVDPLADDYHLTEYSPCIDTGDPASPLDPDGTIADMGAYYYHQSGTLDSPQNLKVEIIGSNVLLSWDAVAEANSYKVYSSDDPFTGFAEDTSGTFTGESWSTSIINEKKFYNVKASTEIIRFNISD